jgi:hypothetical protein
VRSSSTRNTAGSSSSSSRHCTAGSCKHRIGIMQWQQPAGWMVVQHHGSGEDC